MGGCRWRSTGSRATTHLTAPWGEIPQTSHLPNAAYLPTPNGESPSPVLTAPWSTGCTRGRVITERRHSPSYGRSGQGVEVFDRIETTQAPRDVGSVLPKSFNLSTATGDRVWVAPNATKHIWEETRGLTFGRGISQEQRIMGLADAVDNAAIGKWEKIQVSRGWELIFSEPRRAEANPVLKHARYVGGCDS